VIGAGLEPIISTDYPREVLPHGSRVLVRPAALAQDDTPMIDVVKHALDAIPGAPDDIWLLVQPTQPLRKPEHLREAVRLLRETQADSVVSVVELPRTHSAYVQLRIERIASPIGRLRPFHASYVGDLPARRQAVDPTYVRDGTCYAFWRRTVDLRGNIYGASVVPLIIDPQDTCELDSPEQWDALEARLRSAPLQAAAERLRDIWRAESARHKKYGDCYRVGQGWGMEQCANELDAVLSASAGKAPELSGQPSPGKG
jgi:CMP-N-acetylneuraminic acid synthetase